MTASGSAVVVLPARVDGLAAQSRSSSTSTATSTSTVTSVDAVALPSVALGALRTADVVYLAPDVDAELAEALGFPPAPDVDRLLADAEAGPVLLITTDVAAPAAVALRDAGARVLETVARQGSSLLEAVAVMDRLRSPGGCPWDAEQTHDSLRTYLVEETYELLDAIDSGADAELAEELGDVLLQVLFHARLAQEHAEPFDIDDVANVLVRKLIGRHPHVFGGGIAGDSAVHDAESQQHRWEQLKQREKRRESIVDGVATGQPALALAAKLVQRADRARVPADLLPGDLAGDRVAVDSGAGDSDAGALFALVAKIKRAGGDPEDALRSVALDLARRVRAAERAARAAGVDQAGMDAPAWRKFWPNAT